MRNSWLLRRELWARLRGRPTAPSPKPIRLRCIACGHELTKPCRRGRWQHLIRWPAEADGLAGYKAGELVAIPRQKPRGGAYQPYYFEEPR